MTRPKRKQRKAPVLDENAIRPTPEREARNPTQSAGMARRIIPMIDTLASKGHLSPKEHEALAYYRDQAGLADRSPVRSCCDPTPRGGGHGPGIAILSAVLETARLERAMGPLYHIARAVAVDDWSLSRWCIEKHGGRERYDGKGKLVAIVPVCEKEVEARALYELKLAAKKILGHA